MDVHCNLPLLHGFLPYCPSRGTCEIRSANPNLWFMVAWALGIWVALLRCQSPIFVAMDLPFCPQAAVLAAIPRQCNTLPYVIFSNDLSLPWGDRAYWVQWPTPHVFLSQLGILI